MMTPWFDDHWLGYVAVHQQSLDTSGCAEDSHLIVPDGLDRSPSLTGSQPQT